MSSKKKDLNEDVMPEATATVPEVKPSGPIPGEVVVVNKLTHSLDITLTDGTNLSVGQKGSKFNESRPVAKKLLPPYVLRLAREGKILLRSAV